MRASSWSPCPAASSDDDLRALVFDSHYDPFRGVMVYVRVVSGQITKKIVDPLLATEKTFEVLEVGVFAPGAAGRHPAPGRSRLLLATIKKTADVKIGDTVTSTKNPAE